MATKAYSIYNKTRESSVTTSITAIDSSREPLVALRAMVEGPGSDNATGLWLTHVTSFPMVPRLSPFDLIYLDKDHCVLERFELLPATDIPRFKSPASSALILPFQTISATRIDAGDEFLIDELRAGEAPAAAGETGTVTADATRTQSSDANTARTTPPPSPPDRVSLTIREASPANPVEESATSRPLITQAQNGQKFSRHGRRKRRRNRQAFSPASPGATEAQVPASQPSENRTDVQEQPERESDPDAPSSIFASFVPLDLEVLSQPAKAKAEVPGATASNQSLPSLARSEGAAEIREDPMGKPLESKDIAATFVPAASVPAIAPVPPLHGQDRATELAVRLEDAKATSLSAGRGKAGSLENGARSEKNEAAEMDRKPVVHRILSWLYPSLYKRDRRQALRRPLEGLVAYEQSSEGPRKIDIGNISSSGIYLLTEARWNPGERISLSLQRSGPFEKAPERRIDLNADPVRWGSDGIGLSFVWPEGMDLRLWEAPATNHVFEGEPDYIVREMRMARAIAFLRRICPTAVHQSKDLFHTVLSNVRVANAVEISLKAERLLMEQPNAHSLLAHPELIIRILQDGSWVDVDSIQRLWAGLLATCCTLEGQDESNRVYINLLSLLAPIHTRILSAACDKAVRVMAESEADSSSHLVACSAEEMAVLSGASNLTKVHRSIAELSDLGLLEKTTRTSPRSVSSITRARPTHLGLEMYARCNGRRGAA